MQLKFLALALIAGLPVISRAQAPSLEKIWETDTIVATPESVLPDPAAGILYVPGFNGKTVTAYRLKGAQAMGQIGRPGVLLTDAGRLTDLKKKIAQRDPAVLDLVQRLEEQADKLLTMKPVSVMEKSSTPVSGSKHDYMSQAPYFWYDSTKPNGLPYVNRDGQRNPEIYGITDRTYIGRLDNAVRLLGLAWWLTREEKYAQKAAVLLRCWFLDDSTRMNPNLEYGQAIPGVNTGRGIGIIETIALMGIADGAALLDGSSAWTAGDAGALRRWYAQYLDWMLTSSYGKEEHAAKNNHGVWWLAQATDFALFTGNPSKARELAEEGKEKMDSQIQADGKMPKELARTTGLWYSTYNLQAFFTLATLAHLVGVDLWHYSNQTNAGIRAAFDWLIPYAAGEKKWEYQQISPYDPTEFYSLLLQAGKVYGEEKYIAEARAIGKKEASAVVEVMWGE
jgi:hypothetical protein